MSCDHVPSIKLGKDMKSSHLGFTLLEVTALIAIMAAVVILATPKFTAWRLTASICSFPDTRHHAECLRTGMDQHTASGQKM
jgi:hypothetical protein